jgi:hypothetical protein
LLSSTANDMNHPFASALSCCAVMLATVFVAADASAVSAEQIEVSEVAPPPPSSGVDRVSLKNAAEGEIRQLAAPRTKPRKVLVSLAVTGASDVPVACTVNATLRDAQTGTMIAVIEGNARAEGAGSVELKKQVARAAVRSAVRQFPDALR